MPVHLYKTKYKGVFVQNAPNTYNADLTPENMQHGMKGWSKGKLVVGTGKAFEFARYGHKRVSVVNDPDGAEKYGIEIDVGTGTNLILITPDKGDLFVQTKHIVALSEGVPVVIGRNMSSDSDVYALQSNELVKIYFSETQDFESRIRFFIGKDNEL